MKSEGTLHHSSLFTFHSSLNMNIYPAIDLRNGQVVRLKYGDPNQQTVFEVDPLKVARRWAEAGAAWLHVVNLDGAFGDDAGAAAKNPAVSRPADAKLKALAPRCRRFVTVHPVCADIRRSDVGHRSAPVWDRRSRRQRARSESAIVILP